MRAILVILSLTLLAIGSQYAFSFYNNRSSAVGFDQYEPTKLPGGLTIDRRVIEVWQNKTNPLAPNKLLRIHTSDKDFTIGEEKYKKDFTYGCDLPALNETCQINTTRNGQAYTLKTATNYIDSKYITISQDVYLRQGNTHVWINVTGNPAKTYTEEEWNTMIDSLQRTKYKQLPVEHYVPGP